MYNNSLSSKRISFSTITTAAATLTITLIIAAETVILTIIPQIKKYQLNKLHADIIIASSFSMMIPFMVLEIIQADSWE